jgi:acyl-coenzyme A synthetase/AMP-(fatty) acid ligase
MPLLISNITSALVVGVRASRSTKGGGVPVGVTERSVPAVLRARAHEKPDAAASTYMDSEDYELDPEGCSQALIWSQLHRRVQAVAGETASCGSPRDRAAILAPQGLEYIVGFFAALEAGSRPFTTSGKVRRSAGTERYDQDELTRLDAFV